MAGDASFDVVSDFDEMELRNALDQVRRGGQCLAQVVHRREKLEPLLVRTGLDQRDLAALASVRV